MLKKILSNIGFLAIIFSLGFAIYYFFLNPNSPLRNLNTDYSTLSSQALFASQLKSEYGVKQDLSQYKGKIIVVNFWATWCPPCREEMPELSALHSEYKNKNVLVLGIAVDDPVLVKKFSQESPVSYPLFAAEYEGMELAGGLGNDKDILPYTVIINADGAVVETYFGRINKTLLESALRPLF